MSGVIRSVTILITHIRGLITRPITTHEPPSRLLLGFPAKVPCEDYFATSTV